MTAENNKRPWGFYEVLQDKPNFKLKRIEVLPKCRLSYQKHKQRAEHWFIVQGRACVTLEGQEIQLKAGEAIDIPLQAAHRIQNPDEHEVLVFIEIQTGTYFGEDDIERLSDDFGRV